MHHFQQTSQVFKTCEVSTEGRANGVFIQRIGITMKRYLVIIEKTKTGYSAYSPDILGCVAIGKTKKEVEQNMREAIQFHLEGLALEGDDIPQSLSYSRYMEIAA